MSNPRPYPTNQRQWDFTKFEQAWKCPRCGGGARVFRTCSTCNYETWGRFVWEHAPTAAQEV